MTKRVLTFLTVVLVISFGISAYALISNQNQAPRFVTWDSLEPDTWASIWLIKTYINSDARIDVVVTGDDLGDGTHFGVPNAQFNRNSQESTFESLLKGFDQTDPVLFKIGAIISAIEATRWGVANDPLTHVTEQNFRRLQDRFDRDYVPVSCYAGFFNALYNSISLSQNENELNRRLSSAATDAACDALSDIAQRKRASRVKEIEVSEVLSEIAMEKDVVFVDVREPQEFQKSHIPGAINIPMYKMSPEIYEQLKKADRVISYCVKDFRGYEAARLMLENGVNNVAVMNPYGLSGWQEQGLPLTNVGEAESDKQQALRSCAKDRQQCHDEA